MRARRRETRRIRRPRCRARSLRHARSASHRAEVTHPRHASARRRRRRPPREGKDRVLAWVCRQLPGSHASVSVVGKDVRRTPVLASVALGAALEAARANDVDHERGRAGGDRARARRVRAGHAARAPARRSAEVPIPRRRSPRSCGRCRSEYSRGSQPADRRSSAPRPAARHLHLPRASTGDGRRGHRGSARRRCEPMTIGSASSPTPSGCSSGRDTIIAAGAFTPRATRSSASLRHVIPTLAPAAGRGVRDDRARRRGSMPSTLDDLFGPMSWPALAALYDVDERQHPSRRRGPRARCRRRGSTTRRAGWRWVTCDSASRRLARALKRRGAVGAARYPSWRSSWRVRRRESP